MPRHISLIAITIVGCLATVASCRAQDDKWNNNPPPVSRSKSSPGPAPKRDLSGIWFTNGNGAKGAMEHPDDPAHVGRDVPYTTAGLAARAKNKPGEGERQVPAGQSNDPWNICDPEGFPRMLLFELRLFQFVQTKKQVLFLDNWDNQFRTIWTDGRTFPKDPDPRWNGYSVGHWEDDYTFVVQTVGMNEKAWLDNVGRPHSDALQAEERWHRVDQDNMELTVTINDPKYYTQSWIALNKLKIRLLPDDFEGTEILCVPSELQEYNHFVSDQHN